MPKADARGPTKSDGAAAFAPKRVLPRSPRDEKGASPQGAPRGLSVNLDPKEAVAFVPKALIPRSPRSEEKGPVSGGSPSTLEKVLQDKEARKAAEEQERLILLREARVEHYRLRKRLLASDKGEYLDTMLVLDWSAGAVEMGKTFVHARNRRASRNKGVGVPAEEDVPEPAMSLAELRQQWIEATCLLRSNMTTVEAFEQARSTVRTSLAFLDALGAIAAANSAALQGGTGTIFQELLKDLAMCGVSGMMIDNLGDQGSDMSFEDAAKGSAMAGELGVKDKWAMLLRQAHDVRCIVRIKLQDANDLKAAQYALECCSTCFQEISAHSKARGISNFQMVQVLEGDEE